MSKPPPTITHNLKDFLDYLWGYKDKSVVDLEEAQRIQDSLMTCDNPHDYCHIQSQTNEGEPLKDERGKAIAYIWRPSDWALDFLKWKEMKIQSEIRNKKHEVQKDIRNRLEEAIRKDLGVVPGHEQGESLVKSLALRIFTTKNAMLAKHYGVEIPPDEFDELIILATKEPRETPDE